MLAGVEWAYTAIVCSGNSFANLSIIQLSGNPFRSTFEARSFTPSHERDRMKRKKKEKNNLHFLCTVVCFLRTNTDDTNSPTACGLKNGILIRFRVPHTVLPTGSDIYDMNNRLVVQTQTLILHTTKEDQRKWGKVVR